MTRKASKTGEQGTPAATEKRRPRHELRIGSVAAAIWENEGENGRKYLSVTLYSVYKTKDGQWQRSTSFHRDDLLAAAKLLDMAHSWIIEWHGAAVEPASTES